MNRSWHYRLTHSLALQMAGLTLVAVGFFLAYFIVFPYLDAISGSTDEDRTRTHIRGQVWEALREEPDNWKEVISNSTLIHEVELSNPEFRLYVQKNDEVLQRGKPPLGIGKLNIPRRRASLTTNNQARNHECADQTAWGAQFEEGNTTAIISYNYCDGNVTLIEIGGISKAHDSLKWWTWLPERLWVLGNDVIIPFLLFLVVIGSALWLVARLMGRLAGIAEQLDLDNEEYTLPEKGIPTEVLPLVTAFNELLSRLKDSREQQRFFLSAAAHELRTPLALLRVRLEDLPDGESKNRLIKDMNRMKGVVEQLLQLMSVKNRAAPTGKIDLVKAARNIVANRALLALEQGVEIIFETEVESCSVTGDKRLIEVAVGNLIDNAVGVSQSGDEVTVGIDARKQLTVGDNGPGVPAESVATIFQPFNKYPPGKNGHGLGLAIVDAIMDLVGGSVRVRNKPDGGALFDLRFP